MTIPDSVTYIDSDAFAGCSSLVSITIPDNVTSIGDYAFEDCSKCSVYLPDYVDTIGFYAFEGTDRVLCRPGIVTSAMFTNLEVYNTEDLDYPNSTFYDLENPFFRWNGYYEIYIDGYFGNNDTVIIPN